MLCQQCKTRPATLHLTKIINNEKIELHICEGCAREKGEMMEGAGNAFSIHSLLAGLLYLEPSGKGTISGMSSLESLQCEKCGMTYSHFSKIGRFGCSSCYDYFNVRLEPLFKRVHGNTVHVGKVPARAGGRVKIKRKIESLKQELQQNILREEFERAAQIRDQIRQLEKE